MGAISITHAFAFQKKLIPWLTFVIFAALLMDDLKAWWILDNNSKDMYNVDHQLGSKVANNPLGSKEDNNSCL